ncbi:Mitochondrial division protein 1 [Wickerhamomyces ciferrii]|uniref:Mitochondrial division protein 1 n=1 Tax=Wickerhamomyces ciferrii (strain ATCC 14091 / BCRC 22168 / CBS 111 / JCM 3599 / NBRC 0793 / NRRL Y-1031 F-60-10) TaxID=1206466 RepID=K0KEL3_WICCF|nr:Mitochondrial division protein 1 [Wickerhamomyces ciferrii]CCH41356.1 Mitochondrial division protein 1 [Wickerhamomyces ciferrii]
MSSSNTSSGSNGTDLYSTTTRFSQAVTATASALIHPHEGSSHNDALLSNSSYKKAMREALNNNNTSFALSRRRNNHGKKVDLYGSRYATSTEYFRNAFSSSKTAYKVLTHIPDDLLDEIPDTKPQKDAYSLFQGFNAALPEINEEISQFQITNGEGTNNDDSSKEFLKKLTEKAAKDQEKEDEDDYNFKLPNGINKTKISNSYSTNKLQNYKNQLIENLESLEIRKNLAASEIIELDNKISKLQSLRKIVFKRVAKIEQNELFLESHTQDIDDRIQMIKDYNMEQPDEDELEEEQVTKEDKSSTFINGHTKKKSTPSSRKISKNEENDINNDQNDEIDDEYGEINDETFKEGKPLMSQSIYGKLQEKPPKFKKKNHKNRKTMPTLQQYYEPGTKIKSIQAHEESINCFDFDIPFGTMVSASLDNTVKVWDLSKGKSLGLLEGHIAPVSSIQMDDSLVVTGSLDATLKLWDLGKLNHDFETIQEEGDEDDGPCIYSFESHIEEITALSFHNYTLVSGSQDRTLRQWDLTTGHCLQTIDVLWASQINQTTNVEQSVVVDRVNPFIGCLQTYDAALATGTSDGLVRLWDLRSGEVVRSLVGHTAPVTCLQFDDKYLATGSLDRSIRIWDLRTGGIHDAFAYESPITSLQFDSRRIVSSNNESSVKIYDRIDEKHSSCGGEDPDSATVNYVRYKEGYMVEGRTDGKITAWAV